VPAHEAFELLKGLQRSRSSQSRGRSMWIMQLSDEMLQELSLGAAFVTFSAGERLVAQGEEATFVSLLLRGCAAERQLESGQRRICYAMLCYAMLCYAMLCYAMLCCAMRCDAMRCDAMRCDPIRCDAAAMRLRCGADADADAMCDAVRCAMRC
jgi:hypothetical protein